MHKMLPGLDLKTSEFAETAVKSLGDSLQLTADQRRLLRVVRPSRHGERIELVKCAFDNPLTNSAWITTSNLPNSHFPFLPPY